MRLTQERVPLLGSAKLYVLLGVEISRVAER